jgi:transcriptional regulator with XRE-family HTH domain
MNERGLSITETAQRASEHLPEGEVLSRAALRHYLRGRSLPRMRYLDALALGLGVERSELIGPLGDADQGRGTVRVEGVGDEAQLWVEQRVPWPPWPVAWEILRLLGAERRPEMAVARCIDPPGSDPDRSGEDLGSKLRSHVETTPDGPTGEDYGR